MAYPAHPGMTPHPSYNPSIYPGQAPGYPLQPEGIVPRPSLSHRASMQSLHHGMQTPYSQPGAYTPAQSYAATPMPNQYQQFPEDEYEEYEDDYVPPAAAYPPGYGTQSVGARSPYHPAAVFDDVEYPVARTRSYSTGGAYTPHLSYASPHGRSRSRSTVYLNGDQSMVSLPGGQKIVYVDGGRSHHRSRSHRRSHSHRRARSHSRHHYDDYDYDYDRDYDRGHGRGYSTASRIDISQIPGSARPYSRSGGGSGLFGTRTKLIKFRMKGALWNGITLRDAENSTAGPLAHREKYTFYDLRVDDRSRIKMRMMWTGYRTLTYDIPVDGHGGRVDLATLLRRVARGVRHYLETNRIPISWDRVKIQHLEEVAMGTWQPLVITH